MEDAAADDAAVEEEYRIDELAARAGTTVRNVRAYQDRGLIPPPERRGRVGVYSDQHLARLRLIGEMLSRGYSLSNIGELFAAWEQGQDLGELLGFEAALAAPWGDEVSVTMPVSELLERFGGSIDHDTLREAGRIGVIELDGDVVHVNSPRLLEAGAALVEVGVPLDAVVEHGRALRADIERVAERFVDLAATEIIEPYGSPIPAQDLPHLTEIVQRLRPMVARVVDAELARAMDRLVRERLQATMDRRVTTAPAHDEAS
ncbi:MAG: MerR family transcriptional regulator [Microthrixaceae bacterium]